MATAGSAGVLLALAAVLPVTLALDGSYAARTISLVLAEAIALYLGYGAVERAAGPAVHGLLVGE